MRKTELSERERQLLALAADGHTDTSIANKLGISEATVSTYWGRVRIKMGPYSRTELVALVIREEQKQIIDLLREENNKLSKRILSEKGEQVGEHGLYKDLINAAADAIFIVNESGMIEMANETAAHLFGYDVHELEGRPVSDLIPERYRVVHNSHRDKYMANPEKRHMGEHLSTLALHKSGREFSIAATLSAVRVDNRQLVTCIVRPVDLSLTILQRHQQNVLL